MKTITMEWLKEKRACRSGREWFEQQDLTAADEILRQLVAEDQADDAYWLASRLLTHSQNVKWARWCADESNSEAAEAEAAWAEAWAEAWAAAWWAAEEAAAEAARAGVSPAIIIDKAVALLEVGE